MVPNIGHFFEVLAWSHKFEYPLSRLAIGWRTQSTLLHLLYYVRHIILPCLVAIRASTADEVFSAVGRELGNQSVDVDRGWLLPRLFLLPEPQL